MTERRIEITITDEAPPADDEHVLVALVSNDRDELPIELYRDEAGWRLRVGVGVPSDPYPTAEAARAAVPELALAIARRELIPRVMLA